MRIAADFQNQILFGISWGTAVIPRRAYFCIELPFLTIQVYLWKVDKTWEDF